MRNRKLSRNLIIKNIVPVLKKMSQHDMLLHRYNIERADIVKKKNVINLVKYYMEKNDAGFRNEAMK